MEMKSTAPEINAKPYIPITSYEPAFANVVPVSSAFPNVPEDVMGILAAAETLSIRQHVKVLPRAFCACPPCVKQTNTYSIYAGLTRDDEKEFLRIDEVSHDWSRCCCSPYHPLKLEARQYIPPPGSKIANSDWDHLKGDVNNDFSRYTNVEKVQYMQRLAAERPVLFTMIRDDGMRCTPVCDCKWLNTFVCFRCCQDGMEVYAGPIADGEEAGRLDRNNKPPVENLMGSIIQPNFGGCCIPVLELRGEQSAADQVPFGKVEGPCCFGGFSEYCWDFNFFVSSWQSRSKAGDMGLIVKKKPSSAAAMLIETISDADHYSIQFSPDQKLTGSQKATILGAQILADYMYFDGNTEKCKTSDEGYYCYLWYCSIIGLLTPCVLFFPKNT